MLFFEGLQSFLYKLLLKAPLKYIIEENHSRHKTRLGIVPPLGLCWGLGVQLWGS